MKETVHANKVGAPKEECDCTVQTDLVKNLNICIL